MNRNGFKENLPRRTMTPEVGLVAKLGGYSEKRQKLQEERRQEYNRMLAEQKMKPGSRPSKDAAQVAPQGNTRRDPGFDQWDDDGPRPPRKGWATPTYEEILDRKRKQERNYRQLDDPFDRNRNLGDADYSRMSLSDGNLNQRFSEENDRLVALDREFEEKKVRFLNDWRPSSHPNDDSSFGYDELQSRYNHQRKNSQPQDMPPQTLRQNLRKTGSEPEGFNGTLMIGKEVSSSQDRRKKGAYRQELEQQMEEAKARKIREKMEGHQTSDGLMDRMGPGRIERPQPPSGPAPGYQSSLLPQTSPMYTMQTQVDDMRLRRGGGEGRFYEDQVTGAGGILANGFHFNTQRSPLSNAPPENSLGLNPYSSPLSDAYHYYGMQNPLDPNLAYGVPSMPSLMPPAQAMSAYPMGSMGNLVPGLPQQMATYSPPRPSAIIPPPSVGSRSGFPMSAVNSQKKDSGGIMGENPDERKRAEEEKKKMYQIELQRQMGEDKLKKQRQKEEQDRYDKKLEAEIANYSPFGQPGGGAPMRDKYGNIVSSRNQENMTQAWTQNAANSQVAADHQMAGLPNPYNTFDQNRLSDPTLDLYRSPLLEHQAKHHPPGLQDQAADGEAKFARGGHGIFGEPMTDEQKNSKQKYQDELRKQIEEKKRKAEEEKQKQQKEEEQLLKRIEEDNLKIQREQEEEKRKQREKAEQAELQQQELKRHQEEQKQEAERRKKEAQEVRKQEQLKTHQQDEDRHKAEQLERIKSPPLPAAAAVASRKALNSRPTQQVTHQQRNSSPVSVDRTKSQQSQQRIDSARALDHLAKMKQKLNSERKRVESDLKKEKMAPEVFDPRLVISRPPRHHDAGIFETPRNKSSSTHGRKGATSHHEAYPYIFDEQREIQADDGFRDNPAKEGHPPIREGLEDWQRVQLERQEEELKRLKKQRSVAEDSLPGEELSRPGSNLLDAETEFFGIPDSRAGIHDIPDDLEDMKIRPKSSSNRRHRKVKISVEQADPTPPPLSRMGSVSSLDPEELKRKNEERLRKLKSLEGDDVSSGNPDDILKHFMETRKHSRPPSSNTLMDDSWLRPGSTGR